MKVYKILHDPHPKLKEKAEAVEVFDDNLKDSVIRMIATLKRSGGIGLAGNQVGLMKRVIVIDTLSSNTPGGFLGALINPVILEKSDNRKNSQEGCLSFPDKAFLVERQDQITVHFQNVSGISSTRKFSGLTAICIQHEIDHLDGITFDMRAVAEIK